MRQITIFLFAAISPVVLDGQEIPEEFGAKTPIWIGVSYSKDIIYRKLPSPMQELDNYYKETPLPKSGFSIEGIFSIDISKKVSLKTGVSYLERGEKSELFDTTKNINPLSATYIFEVERRFLDLHLALKHKLINNKFKLNTFIGLLSSTYLLMRYTKFYPGLDLTKKSRTYSTIDPNGIGFFFGFELGYIIKDRLGIWVLPNFQNSRINYTHTIINYYTLSVPVSITYKIRQ